MPERNQQRGKNIEIYLSVPLCVHLRRAIGVLFRRYRSLFLSPASDRIYLARREKGNLLRKSRLRIRGALTLIDTIAYRQEPTLVA